ncbi:MAG: hypothetical protein GX601_04775 [Anaerolineales bacterium]|nr:hypothetical protein [Anaerolineales bacterium]
MVNRLGYVELVATDLDYQRSGLGSEQPFYRPLGFRRLYTQRYWMRNFPPSARAKLSAGRESKSNPSAPDAHSSAR